MARSPAIQARIAQNHWKKKKEMSSASVSTFLAGAKQAARVARTMIDEGWSNTKTFEKEVLRRITTAK